MTVLQGVENINLLCKYQFALQNTSMERMSSYSTGGSGANSDNEALTASLQNCGRLEVVTQVRHLCIAAPCFSRTRDLPTSDLPHA